MTLIKHSNNIHIFKLNKSKIPLILRRMRNITIYGYIINTDDDGDIDLVYEMVIIPSKKDKTTGVKTKYVHANTKDFIEHEITREEFVTLRPKGQHPGIWDAYIVTAGFTGFHTLMHLNEFDITFGFTNHKHWWWKWHKPERVSSSYFVDFCREYQKKNIH